MAATQVFVGLYTELSTFILKFQLAACVAYSIIPIDGCSLVDGKKNDCCQNDVQSRHVGRISERDSGRDPEARERDCIGRGVRFDNP